MRLASAKAGAATVAAALLLAACATPKPQTMPALPPPPATIAPPMPAPAPVPPPAETMAAPAMPPMARAPLPPPTDAPSLRAAYGAPDFVRRDADAELWRYNGANCTAFFFLYRDGDSWRLRYSETMPRGREQPVDPACIAGLSARAMS